MFTGIIQAVGKVDSIETRNGDFVIGINTNDLDLSAAITGDSIAVNGVCLTAVSLAKQNFVADVSLETMDKTSLGQLKPGSAVNLEKSLTLSTALGGHLVSGHVDGVGSIVAMETDARSTRYSFELAPELQHYIAARGSVTIDGCSLTVTGVENNRFDVNIVPHTADNTIFRYYKKQSQVNIEVDLIARYLERLIDGKAGDGNNTDDQLMNRLINSGFIQQ
jgi:riboflavin synthase